MKSSQMSDDMHFCPHAHDYKDLELQALGISKKNNNNKKNPNLMYMIKAQISNL